MRHQHCALALAFLATVLFACKKDKADSAPVVRILAPAAGSALHIPDTLTVTVEVTDDRLVESVTISLIDAAGVPIGPQAQRVVNAASSTVVLDLTLTNERIESGTYTLEARASDGDQDGRAFSAVIVFASPLRLRSTFVAPPSTSDPPLIITRVDSIGSLSNWISLAELGGIAIDPDHLFVAGTRSQPLVRWSLASGIPEQLLANENVPGSTDPYFTGLRIDPSDMRLYVGTINGLIRGFTPLGIGSFTATCPPGFTSGSTAVVGDLLIAATYHPGTTERRLVNLAYSSGVVLDQFPLDVDPIALFDRDGEHVLVFGNRNGTAVIQDRNATQGGVFEMRTFQNDPIRAVTRIQDGSYAIALESGLVRFTYQSNSVLSLGNIPNASALVYDPSSGALFVGSGNQLITVDPAAGSETDSRNMPTAVGSVMLQLNR